MKPDERAKLARSSAFLHAVTGDLCRSLSPIHSASLRCMAAQTLQVLFQTWPPKDTPEAPTPPDHPTRPDPVRSSAAPRGVIATPAGLRLDVYPPAEVGDRLVVSLLHALDDSWDKLRAAAEACLEMTRRPFHSEAGVMSVLAKAAAHMRSPRIRDSDAGACMLRLLYRHLVVGRGFEIAMHPANAVRGPTRAESRAPSDNGATVVTVEDEAKHGCSERGLEKRGAQRGAVVAPAGKAVKPDTIRQQHRFLDSVLDKLDEVVAEAK